MAALAINDLPDEALAVLVDILNQDVELNAWLGTSMVQSLTLLEFKRTGAEWQHSRRAVTFCIWADRPVGTISLSHRTADGQAPIGYWLASSEWGKGIARQAFAIILDIARRQGIRQVSATIESYNEASLRLWRHHGAREELSEKGQVQVQLDLS